MTQFPDLLVPVVVTRDPEIYGYSWLSQQLYHYKEKIQTPLSVMFMLPNGTFYVTVEPYDYESYIESKMRNARYSIST